VLVEVGAGKAETVAKDEFKQLVRDITLQIAGTSARGFGEQVAPKYREEREIARHPTASKASRRRRWRNSPGGRTNFSRPTARGSGFRERNSKSSRNTFAQIAKHSATDQIRRCAVSSRE